MVNPFLSARCSVALIGACLSITPTAMAESFRTVPGLTLPEVPALLTLDNNVIDPPGGPLFINIWATWCRPCIDELPALNALKARNPDTGIQWIALNYGDSLDEVSRFMANTAIELPVLLDVTTLFTGQLPLKGLPATFLVDSNGRVRYQLDGYADWTDTALIQQWESLIPELTNP